MPVCEIELEVDDEAWASVLDDCPEAEVVWGLEVTLADVNGDVEEAVDEGRPA